MFAECTTYCRRSRRIGARGANDGHQIAGAEHTTASRRLPTGNQLPWRDHREPCRMTDVGYVAIGWITTFVVVAVYATWTIVRGRRLARRFDREDLPWG